MGSGQRFKSCHSMSQSGRQASKEELNHHMKAIAKSLTQRTAWKSLGTHSKQIRPLHLRKLFAADPKRGERFTVEATGLFLDYSKNHINDKTLKLLLQLAKESNLRGKLDAMFGGEK